MAANPISSGVKKSNFWGQLLLIVALLGGALSVLCHEAYKAHEVMWANDAALGALKTTSSRVADTYTGHWMDMWWIGQEVPAAAPTVTLILGTIVTPEFFLKIFAPFTMLLLGFSAWLLFRQLKFSPMVCMVGGLAAGLNMHCFSNACWGLGAWNVCFAMIFLAIAALVTDTIRQTWIKSILAGLAVGMSVMEGFDSGAILSVYVAVFMVFFCWITEPSFAKRAAKTILTGFLVVLFAVLIAASTISTLVGTQIKGIAGTGQSAQEKKEHWEFATAWSLPKIETLRIIIPGLFGYRLFNYDTTPDKAGVYWGKVAEDPRLTMLESSDPSVRTNMAIALRLPPEWITILGDNDSESRDRVVDAWLDAMQGAQHPIQRRHTGSGEYAGILVALLAIFALANSARREGSPYSRNERLMVWFWGLAALFSLVAAWGRHAFLYALLYRLPYFSTIRNPLKFLHPFDIIWIILAGYGLEALYRCWMKPAEAPAPDAQAGPANSPRFAIWSIAVLTLVAGGVILFYEVWASTSPEHPSRLDQFLVQYIQHQGFNEDMAGKIAGFSIGEIGAFAIYLLLSAGVIIIILTGICRGRGAILAWLALAGIMICDLSRADRPWVRYFDYTQKYSMNPIVEFLKKDPWEHRVAAKLSPMDEQYILCPGKLGILGGICHWWLENDFPYNDIEAVDADQMPRPPIPEARLFATFAPRFANDFTQSDLSPPFRLWKLCNTRYLLTPAAAVPILNDRADPLHRGFQIRQLFNLVPKPGVTEPEDGGDFTAVTNDTGPFALVEITNALPRAKLYANWQTPTNDDATLQILNSDLFDPMQSVLVGNDTPAPAPSAAPDADAGVVKITDYKPRDVQLHATAKTAAVLLLNDRTSENWRAWIDQKPAPMLRCNYVMQGVYLTPGDHTIEFRFQPPIGPLCVTLAAMAVGLALAGYLIYSRLVVRAVKEKL